MTCSIENCSSDIFCKGLCRKHYYKQYRQDNKFVYQKYRRKEYLRKHPVIKYRSVELEKGSREQKQYKQEARKARKYGITVEQLKEIKAYYQGESFITSPKVSR